MSLHESEPLDIYLGRYLKNWVAHYHAPIDGRSRLLRAAKMQASIREGRKNPFILLTDVFRSDYSDVSFRLLAQATAYSLQTGMVI